MNTNILDFGAAGDGKTLCSAAIQKAVDECAGSGGGRVCIPAGVYLTGTIRLKSNVELYLEHGSVLKASTDLDDYNELEEYPQNSSCIESEGWCGKHLILAVEQENVAVTGSGTIDGSGDFFLGEKQYPFLYIWRDGIAKTRPDLPARTGPLICFVECTNVRVTGIRIQNHACWCLFCHGCECVRIHGIQVFNEAYYANSDGIDIDSCRFVTVSDCIINTGDDAIAIRGNAAKLKCSQKACEYVTISNCVLSSSSSVFRIGVGIGKIRHIRVHGIVIERGGEAINLMTSYCGRGEVPIEDVNFSDISATNVSFPINISSNAYIRNITIENFRCHATASVNIYALPKCSGGDGSLGEITNIMLKNIEIFMTEPALQPSEAMYAQRGEAIIHGENASDILLDGVRIHISEELLKDWNDVTRFENCGGAEIRNCVFPK